MQIFRLIIKNSIIICSFIEKQLCLHGKFLRYLRSNGIFLTKVIVGKGMPEMRNLFTFYFLNL